MTPPVPPLPPALWALWLRRRAAEGEPVVLSAKGARDLAAALGTGTV